MFDGTWKAISGKLGTDTIPLPETELMITGETYEVRSPEGVDHGALAWGMSDGEHTVRMQGMSGPHSDTAIDALARVKGDLMQLCYAVDGSGRPTSFSAQPGQAIVTVRYKRVSS